MTIHRHITRAGWQVLAGIAGAALLVSAWHSLGALERPLQVAGLVPEEEHLTELYFLELPTIVDGGNDDRQLAFTFVIRNLEGEPTTYPYTVKLHTASGDTLVLTENSAGLVDGAVQHVALSYELTDSFLGGVIEITVSDQQQTIRYHLPTA